MALPRRQPTMTSALSADRLWHGHLELHELNAVEDGQRQDPPQDEGCARESKEQRPPVWQP